jgi:hypothetical protein
MINKQNTNNLLGNIILQEVADKLNAFQFLFISTNYLQFIDINNNFIEIQYCYKTKKWYQFKTFDFSNNPIEQFIKYI